MDFNEEVKAKVDYEFSHRFNHTLHAYIDISEDLIAGTLLSQIMYWFSKDKSGNRKVKIYKDGYYWLAKGRNDWADEIRISSKQYDNAIKKLKKKGFVETKLYKFESVPTTHIRPIYDSINKEIEKWKCAVAEEISQDVDLNLPKGEIGIYPNGKTEFTQRDNSITETTNKDYYTDNTNINAFNSEESNVNNINAFNSSQKERALFLDMNNCTFDELKNHYAIRCRNIAKGHSIKNEKLIDDVSSMIAYFCQEYYKTFGEHHPVPSDRSLERVFVKFCYPPDLLEDYDIYAYDDYKYLIDKYFDTEYGKYQISGIVPDYSLSHFMSDEIRTNLLKNKFNIPY